MEKSYRPTNLGTLSLCTRGGGGVTIHAFNRLCDIEEYQFFNGQITGF